MPLICGQTSVVLYPLREDTERPPPAHREDGTETGANRRSSDDPMTDRHDVVWARRENGTCLRNTRGTGAGAGLDPMGTHDDVGTPAGGMLHDHEHVKGTLSKARGKVEEGLGKVTGNKREQVRGEARQVQGDAQMGLGDVQDAIRKPKNRP